MQQTHHQGLYPALPLKPIPKSQTPKLANDLGCSALLFFLEVYSWTHSLPIIGGPQPSNLLKNTANPQLNVSHKDCFCRNLCWKKTIQPTASQSPELNCLEKMTQSLCMTWGAPATNFIALKIEKTMPCVKTKKTTFSLNKQYLQKILCYFRKKKTNNKKKNYLVNN